jgi:hypothetical protein
VGSRGEDFMSERIEWKSLLPLSVFAVGAGAALLLRGAGFCVLAE